MIDRLGKLGKVTLFSRFLANDNLDKLNRPLRNVTSVSLLSLSDKISRDPRPENKLGGI